MSDSVRFVGLSCVSAGGSSQQEVVLAIATTHERAAHHSCQSKRGV